MFKFFRRRRSLPTISVPPLFGYPHSGFGMRKYGAKTAICGWCKQKSLRYLPPHHTVCHRCGRNFDGWEEPWSRWLEWPDGTFEYERLDWDRRGGNVFTRGHDEPHSREWIRIDPFDPSSTQYIEHDRRPHPCLVGPCEATWYSEGWSDVPGALVHWICGRCQRYRHWGKYGDGPAGPAYPIPSRVQQDEWAKEGRRLMEESRARRQQWIDQEVEGECNARWEGGRCTRKPGHEGAHGQEIAPGLVIAPF